jgi:hypothetical protein
MSTHYCPLSPIYIGDLLDGRVKNVWVHEQTSPEHGPFEKCLTDGRNFLWVHVDADGRVTSFTRYRPNGAPQGILRAIAEAFDVEIVSEHDPRFWGFETKAEWDASWAAVAEQHEQEFYDEVVKFIRGDPNNIGPGTVGMIEAEIAKRLVAKSPDLLAAENRPALIKAVKTIYDRDHVIRVQLTEAEIAAVKMLATHEDDLPQA